MHCAPQRIERRQIHRRLAIERRVREQASGERANGQAGGAKTIADRAASHLIGFAERADLLCEMAQFVVSRRS